MNEWLIAALAIIASLIFIAAPALGSWSNDPPVPGAPPIRNANYTCVDALHGVGIAETPEGPKMVFDFAPGFDSCENNVMDVKPMVHKNKRCLLVRFVEGQAVFCFPGMPV